MRKLPEKKKKKRICLTLAAVPCSQHLECRVYPHTVQPAWESMFLRQFIWHTTGEIRKTQMFSMKKGGSFTHSLCCKAKTFWWPQDEHIVRKRKPQVSDHTFSRRGSFFSKKKYCSCRERFMGKEMYCVRISNSYHYHLTNWLFVGKEWTLKLRNDCWVAVRVNSLAKHKTAPQNAFAHFQNDNSLRKWVAIAVSL